VYSTLCLKTSGRSIYGGVSPGKRNCATVISEGKKEEGVYREKIGRDLGLGRVGVFFQGEQLACV